MDVLILLIGLAIGAGLGGWGGWHHALVNGRNKIDAADNEKRAAVSASQSANDRAEEAEQRLAAIEAAGVAEAVALGLLEAPKEIEGAGKWERVKGVCTCGHPKSFHKREWDAYYDKWRYDACSHLLTNHSVCRCLFYVDSYSGK